MKDNQAKYPQLRFKGFTDPWEQRKLGELFKPSRNKNNNDLYNQKDILAASLGTELIPKRTFFGLKSTKESVKNYRVVKHGDLIYTKSPIKGFPNGIVRTNKGNVGIVPSLYCVYQAQKEINTSIIQLYFEDKNRLDFYLFPLVNVGARNNVNITDLEFLEGIIKVPKSIEEQKKIVDFIEHFNKAIILHQRKLAKLKELKQGYLQKLFPKNGSKFPQLRFKGFADAWEQRKLGELGKIYTGNTPKTSDLDNWTDNKEGHIWITPTDIDKLIMSDSDRHLSEQGWSKARKIPENSVLITSIASIGKNTINAVPVAFNQQINAIVPEKNDSYFILSAMIKDTARFASVAGQTATAIINKTTFEKFQIATPSYEEQQKIGSFFKQLDNTITLHQRKLEKLQELKKGYLQKMFC